MSDACHPGFHATAQGGVPLSSPGVGSGNRPPVNDPRGLDAVKIFGDLLTARDLLLHIHSRTVTAGAFPGGYDHPDRVMVRHALQASADELDDIIDTVAALPAFSFAGRCECGRPVGAGVAFCVYCDDAADAKDDARRERTDRHADEEVLPRSMRDE